MADDPVVQDALDPGLADLEPGRRIEQIAQATVTRARACRTAGSRRRALASKSITRSSSSRRSSLPRPRSRFRRGMIGEVRRRSPANRIRRTPTAEAQSGSRPSATAVFAIAITLLVLGITVALARERVALDRGHPEAHPLVEPQGPGVGRSDAVETSIRCRPSAADRSMAAATRARPMPAPWRAGSTARLLSSTSPGSGPSIELEVPGDRVVVRCDENAPEADVPVLQLRLRILRRARTSGGARPADTWSPADPESHSPTLGRRRFRRGIIGE